jgi:hypothetical protein
MVFIVAKSTSVGGYRDLLVSAWERGFPDEVLALLGEIALNRDAEGEDDSVDRLLGADESRPFPSEYFRKIVDAISEGSKFVRLANLPRLPADYHAPRKMTKVVRRACRLASYLVLSAHADVAGDVGFLADVQSLAFQAAMHFVLPEIRKKHPDEHSILLHSATLYAVGYSSHDPAHYAYMISEIYGYLGDKERRLASLYDSFRLTPPEDHSYLTKAQGLWSELLDRGEFVEAERFLFSLHRSSLPDQQEEVREMLVDAIRYVVRDERRNAIA